MLRIRARKAALKEQQVRHPTPAQPATGPSIQREPCMHMHMWFLYVFVYTMHGVMYVSQEC